jgi:hypothetical protein
MGKQATKGKGTKHHCPGKSGWVGDESPGGCIEGNIGDMYYCKKHEMPCRNGCVGRFHLKSQAGCLSCKQRSIREAAIDRQAKENHKEVEKDKGDDTFWNPGKDRKNQKK